jgi:hypothetical protein
MISLVLEHVQSRDRKLTSSLRQVRTCEDKRQSLSGKMAIMYTWAAEQSSPSRFLLGHSHFQYLFPLQRSSLGFPVTLVVAECSFSTAIQLLVLDLQYGRSLSIGQFTTGFSLTQYSEPKFHLLLYHPTGSATLSVVHLSSPIMLFDGLLPCTR